MCDGVLCCNKGTTNYTSKCPTNPPSPPPPPGPSPGPGPQPFPAESVRAHVNATSTLLRMCLRSLRGALAPTPLEGRNTGRSTPLYIGGVYERDREGGGGGGGGEAPRPSFVLFSCWLMCGRTNGHCRSLQVRPVYHFTRSTGEMNDPNGLMWQYAADGQTPEYHMFHQHAATCTNDSPLKHTGTHAW